MESENTMDSEPLWEKQPLLLSAVTSLVCLNFKVPLQVRLQFKIYAAQQNMTMTELLLQLFDDRLTSDANQGRPDTLTKQEIKK